MEKRLLTYIALSALTLGLGACMEERSALNMDAPGKYEKTVRTTDDSGTTTERRSSSEVSVDEYGNKNSVVKSRTTRDPKGMFNKTTTSQTKQVIDSNKNTNY